MYSQPAYARKPPYRLPADDDEDTVKQKDNNTNRVQHQELQLSRSMLQVTETTVK